MTDANNLEGEYLFSERNQLLYVVLYVVLLIFSLALPLFE